MNVRSHPSDENRMKKIEHNRPRPYPSRSLWGRRGPRTSRNGRAAGAIVYYMRSLRDHRTGETGWGGFRRKEKINQIEAATGAPRGGGGRHRNKLAKALEMYADYDFYRKSCPPPPDSIAMEPRAPGASSTLAPWSINEVEEFMSEKC